MIKTWEKMWAHNTYTVRDLNKLNENRLAETLGIEFTEITQNSLIAIMPVTEITCQQYGVLHGGASAALAETAGSVASWMVIDNEKQMCVGLEINCNHIKAKGFGKVTAIVTPLHIGKHTHVWDIRINNEIGDLVCISRLTTAIIPKKA